LHLPRLGDVGCIKSRRMKEDMLQLLHWLLLEFLHWSWQEDIVLRDYLKSHLLYLMKSKHIPKTSQAFKFLKRARAIDDVRKAKSSVKLRPGRGKSRNRRYKQAVGPLVIYKENKGIAHAFRNIPGVQCCSVDHLNLLMLAPGGQVGRFIIWTESAFKTLNERFGTYGAKGDSKFVLRNGASYRLPRSVMQNTDVEKIIQSDEVQAVVRDRKLKPFKPILKKNPLKNLGAMIKLNPMAMQLKRSRILKHIKDKAKKEKKAKLGDKWVPNPHEVAVKKFLALSKKRREDTKKRYLDNVIRGQVSKK